jgi:hypothetical protein
VADNPRPLDELPVEVRRSTRRRSTVTAYRDTERVVVLTSVSWAGNQNTRWGSCTPADRSIRLSTRLRGMPAWVLDYVLLHELAHLLRPGHDRAFWQLLETYPRTDRARGFLEGFSAARDLPLDEDYEDYADELDDVVDEAETGDS